MKQREMEKIEIQKKNEESLFNLNKENERKLKEMEYLQLQEEKIDRERKKKIMEENQRQR